MGKSDTDRATSKRINFPEKARQKIAQAAMHICANPGCLRLTGYETSRGDVRAIAEAAHVVPASAKGPRADSHISAKVVGTVANGIWLCLGCHVKCDDDPEEYTSKELRRWKSEHAGIIRDIVGKDLETALVDLRNRKRYVAECRDFLSFMESRRLLYEDMDKEFPPRVLESLNIIRERVTQTRAKVAPDSGVSNALYRIQAASDSFLAGIGPETDLKTLRCDPGNPVWLHFAEQLERFRKAVIIIVQLLADDSGYKLKWIGAFGISSDERQGVAITITG